MLEAESSLPKPKSAVRWKAHTPAQQAIAATAGRANRGNLMERTSATGKCARVPERRNACPLDGGTYALVADLGPRGRAACPNNNRVRGCRYSLAIKHGAKKGIK